MEKHSYKKARVGLYSVGLEAYWGQFENLKSRIHAYNALYRVAIPHDVISGLLGYTEQLLTAINEEYTMRQKENGKKFLNGYRLQRSNVIYNKQRLAF